MGFEEVSEFLSTHTCFFSRVIANLRKSLIPMQVLHVCCCSNVEAGEHVLLWFTNCDICVSVLSMNGRLGLFFVALAVLFWLCHYLSLLTAYIRCLGNGWGFTSSLVLGAPFLPCRSLQTAWAPRRRGSLNIIKCIWIWYKLSTVQDQFICRWRLWSCGNCHWSTVVKKNNSCCCFMHVQNPYQTVTSVRTARLLGNQDQSVGQASNHLRGTKGLWPASNKGTWKPSIFHLALKVTCFTI